MSSGRPSPDASSEARSTDARSFQALFATNYDDLMRYSARRVGADAASDVVSEVFLTAWRRRGEYDMEAARLWLFGVAHNIVANAQRSERRRVDLRRRAERDGQPETPNDPAETATSAVYVQQALAELPWPEQEALRLTEWDQLTPAEAAQAVGCSGPAFRVRLHRARRHLAERLSDGVVTPEAGADRSEGGAQK